MLSILLSGFRNGSPLVSNTISQRQTSWAPCLLDWRCQVFHLYKARYVDPKEASTQGFMGHSQNHSCRPELSKILDKGRGKSWRGRILIDVFGACLTTTLCLDGPPPLALQTRRAYMSTVVPDDLNLWKQLIIPGEDIRDHQLSHSSIWRRNVKLEMQNSERIRTESLSYNSPQTTHKLAVTKTYEEINEAGVHQLQKSRQPEKKSRQREGHLKI